MKSNMMEVEKRLTKKQRNVVAGIIFSNFDRHVQDARFEFEKLLGHYVYLQGALEKYENAYGRILPDKRISKKIKELFKHLKK